MTYLMDIIDYGLLVANLYVILRIRISRDEAFKTPFFYWFFLTGITSSLSVVGFIIAVRFTFPAQQSYGIKFGYNWSRNISYVLTSITVCLSFGACLPVCWCEMTYTVKGNITVVVYLDDACTVVQKSRSSAMYFLYSTISIVLTFLTSREFMKLSRLAGDSTKGLILSHQRNMFIIVLICTATQMIKAIHQVCWVFVAAFGMTNLNIFLQKTYVITHYLVTYSITVSLVLFNKKVRRLMFLIRIRDTPLHQGNHTRTNVVSTH